MSTKKQRADFRKGAEELIRKHGGKLDDDGFYWLIESKYGPWKLHICDHEYKKTIGTVFTRFDDSALASGSIDCAPISGKWNHFYFDRWYTLEKALESLAYHLSRVAPIQEPDDSYRFDLSGHVYKVKKP